MVILLKIVKTCSRTAGIVGRIVRISEETNATCVKTGAICGKTPETSKLTVRTSARMKVPYGRVGSSCSRMSAPGLVPHSSNRIGRIFGRTDRPCGVIAVTCGKTDKIGGRIARISARIGEMSGRIDVISARIVKTVVMIAKTSVRTARNGPVGADKLLASARKKRL